MIDLNMKQKQNRKEEPSVGLIIGTVVVVSAWMIWAFIIGGML